MYEYKGILVAEITEDKHAELMKYWTEDKKDIQMPAENVFSYLCHFEKGNYWDVIQAMETSDGLILFGESFIHKEYALRWIAGEYDDTDELKEEDRKAGKNNMATIYTMIPYDKENNYCVTVKEEDKGLVTDIINEAYNDWLGKEEAGDFESYLKDVLKEHGLWFELSIWKEEE